MPKVTFSPSFEKVWKIAKLYERKFFDACLIALFNNLEAQFGIFLGRFILSKHKVRFQIDSGK